MAVSEELPAADREDLLNAAREAFTQGLQVAAFASAVIAGTTAVIAVIWMRNVRPAPAEESAAPSGDRQAPVPLAEK